MRLDFWRRASGQATAASDGDGSVGVGGDSGNPTAVQHSVTEASSSTAAAATPSAAVIVFDKSSLVDDNSGQHVFQVNEDTVGKQFAFSQADDHAPITIVDVKWMGMKTWSKDFGSFESISTAEADDNDKFDVNELITSVDSTGAVLNLNEVGDDFLNNTMAIRVDWDNGSSTGFTQSGVFAVVKDSLEPTREQIDQLDAFINGLGPAFVSGTQSASIPSSTGTHPSGAVSDVPAPTSSSSTDDDDTSHSTGGGGLSTGAIAGIAVAAGVIAIALIAGLVWFFLRRRRQNKMHAGYAAQETSNSFMVDKDSHQAVAEDTPRSPYSDDGQITAAAPYDTAAPRDTSPPPANADVSRSVAHLVEDGMTPDEIRRLEEEERQLDDEIERAGRR